MKYLFSTFMLASFCILALTACTNDEAETSSLSGQEVSLSFSVDGVQVKSPRAAAADDYYNEDNLEKVAIILKQTEDSSAADHAPGKPAYNYAPAHWEKKTDGTWGAVDTSADNVLLWKTGSATDTHEVVRFIAYAPETTVQVTTEGNYDNFSIKKDQTKAADRLASDLVLYEAKAQGSSGKIIVNPSTPINLEHKMCRLSLTLTARNEFDASGLKIKKVSVIGVLPQAGGRGTLTTIYSTQEETIKADASASRSFIIGPGTQTLTLKIEADDLSVTPGVHHIYTLPLDIDKEYASATQYNVQVFLGKDKVELSSDGITISNWQEWIPDKEGDDHLETD